MKKNFQKIGKLTLSIVLAFAVVAVSLFTVAPALSINVGALTATDTWDGNTTKPTQTDSEGNIIISTAEELAWIALAGGDETKDKNYKAVAGSVFNMNGMAGITADSTVSEVNDAEKNDSYLWANDSKYFQGNFDGNGLIVYNINGQGGALYGYMGLFTVAKPENTAKTVTIKNVTVAAAFFEAYHTVGGIIGYFNNNSTNKGTVNVENCLVKNCYFNDTVRRHTSASGLMVGHVFHNSSNITNCIAIDNVSNMAMIKGGFVGHSSNFIGVQKVTNSVAIGSLPYPTVVEGSGATLGSTVAATTYTGVYTTETIDKSGITTLTAAQMKGAAAKTNMAGLDWSVMIAFDGEYPSLRSSHSLTTEIVDAANHAIVCSKCNKSMSETHNLVENLSGSAQECSACGYSVAITEKSINIWDGSTKPETLEASGIKGGGTPENPYIIKTVAQLWYIAQKAGAASAGKYYKVADNVGTFDMNNKNWGLADNSCNFQGIFDGNGVEIVNFSASAWNAALFPNVSGTVAIKNTKISGATVNATGGNAGGIVANINGSDTTDATISNCVVENVTVNAVNAAGAVVGTAGNGPKLTIENCLVKNNTVDSQNGAIYSGGPSYMDGVTVGLGWQSAKYTLSNSIILGNEPTYWIGNFNNVYTDQVVSESTYAPEQIKFLTTAQMSGAEGVENMELDFANVWFANAGVPELRVLHDIDTTDNGDGTHSEICGTCHLAGLTSNHAFVNGECACGATCAHTGKVWNSLTAGSCTEADTGYWSCAACGYEGETIANPNTDKGKGHNLTKQKASEATCKDDGQIEHWTCSLCGGIFLTDDKMSTDAKTIDDVIIKATGNHVPLKDTTGEHIQYMKEEGYHSEICAVCGDFFNKTACSAQYTTTETTHSGKCTVCLQDIVEGQHDFDADGKCGICEYQCSHTNVSGAKEENIQGATCTQDGSYDSVTYCENCDKQMSKVTMPIIAAGHDFENKIEVPATKTERGTKAHKYCKVCEKNFDVNAATNAPDSEALSDEDLVLLSLNELATDTWDGTTSKPTKTDGEGNIIIETAEQLAWIALVGGDETKNNNYKVADGVKFFNMNGREGITVNSTAAEVNAAAKNDVCKWNNGNTFFKGNFDGNGVTVYNICNGDKTQGAALFPNVSTDNDATSCTFKNVAVKASYFAGWHGAAGIVGYATATKTTQKINFENCVVENCYMTDLADTNPQVRRTGSTLAGFVGHNGITVDNCLVRNNHLEAGDAVGGFVGNSSAYGPNASIKNSIAIGTTPYSVKQSGADEDVNSQVSAPDNFKDIYTDQTVDVKYTGVTTLTVDEMKGIDGVNAMTALDFENVWFANADIPALRVFHSFDYADNGNGTHSEICVDCEVKGAVQMAHEFDKDGNCTICDYINPCVQNGHDFKNVDEVPATFESTGFAAHKLCKVCGYKFAADADKNISVSESLSDNALIIPVRQHEIECDENGKKIQYFDDKAHWYNCADCEGGKYQYGEHTMEERVLEEGVYRWCEDAEGNACGYELFEYAVSNEEGTVFVSATTNAVSKNVITDIVEYIEEAYGYEEIDKLFKAAGYTNFTAYDVSPTEAVAEGGKITVKIEIPDIYGDSAAIYSVDYKNGKLVKLATKIVEETIKDDKNKDVTIYYAVVEADEFGIFAVAADKPQNAGGTADDSTDTNNGSSDTTGGTTSGDQSTTSPATSADTMAEIAVMTALFGAAVVFARKAKKHNLM